MIDWRYAHSPVLSSIADGVKMIRDLWVGAFGDGKRKREMNFTKESNENIPLI